MLLKIAIKANQALSLPSLLVASLINRKLQATAINLEYVNADSLTTSGKTATYVLELSDGDASSGDQDVIKKLLEAYPTALRGALPHLVGHECLTQTILVSLDFSSCYSITC